MRPHLLTLFLAAAACGGSPGGPSESPATDASGGTDGASLHDAGGADAPAHPDGSAGGKDGGGSSSGGEGGPSEGGTALTGLHIEGNHFVYKGKTTRLLGVDHSGTEYSCVQGNGIYEGPDPDTLATAMLTWGNVNAVRVPLNEDCWLGINGVEAQYAGSAYQTAIVQYVTTLHSHGLFTIVDLHWNAPGTFEAQNQEPMADKDHAIDFWSSVATAFKGDGMTVFDLYNEPYVSTSNAQTTDPWACWKSGCTITSSNGSISGNWQSAGMQDLVTAVRSAGATNPLMLGGLAYADDLSGWLANLPTDPLDQMAASFHLYNFNTCITSGCWDQNAGTIAKQHPVVTGEMGENDCAHGFIDTFMPWADTNGVSYLGWTWNQWDCSSGPALITGYDGSTTGFGAGLKAHLLVTSP
ncbi:MAG TPA: cellulase family glycosylhydrolase [Polyangiaceae bacterium]